MWVPVCADFFQVEAIFGKGEDIFLKELLLAEIGREIRGQRIGQIDYPVRGLRHKRTHPDT